MKKKLFSILLSIAMVVTMMPAMSMTAFADGDILIGSVEVVRNSIGQGEKNQAFACIYHGRGIYDIGDKLEYSVSPSNKGVTIDKNGVVSTTAKAELGTYTITASLKEGTSGYTATDEFLEKTFEVKKSTDWTKLEDALNGNNAYTSGKNDKFSTSVSNNVLTVKLLKDISATKSDIYLHVLHADKKKVVLDLNGCVLNRNMTKPYEDEEDYGKGRVLGLYCDNDFEIKDSNPDKPHKGTVDSDGAWCWNESAKTNVTTIYGGIITGGKAKSNYANPDQYGAGILLGYMNPTHLTMNGGNICGNKMYSNNDNSLGGAICNRMGVFTLNSGSICYNYAMSSSAYYAWGNADYQSILDMHGGEISYNTATRCLAGVAAVSAAKVIMDGGEITHNIVQNSDGKICYGAGIEVGADRLSEFILGGTAKVYDNYIYQNKNKTESNIAFMKIYYDYSKEYDTFSEITLGNGTNGAKAPEKGMRVGISATTDWDYLSDPYTGPFSTECDTDYSKYFYADNPDYYIGYSANHLEIKAPASGNHAINVISCVNGSVTASVKEAAKGDAVTLTASPNSGFELKSLKYNDQKITKNAQGQYQFQMPDKAVTVKAEFAGKKNPVELLTAKASGKKAVKLSWTKLTGATKYVVYGNKSGKKLKKLKTIKANKKASYTVKKIKGSKLKAYKPYKFYVVAYKGSKKLATSKKITFVTGNKMGKYANVKTIKAKKSKVTLAKGKTITVGATYKMYYGKKHLKKSYGAALTYASNCKAVATVDTKGKVTAKAPGTATIYIMDLSGKRCTTTVTVK